MSNRVGWYLGWFSCLTAYTIFEYFDLPLSISSFVEHLK